MLFLRCLFAIVSGLALTFAYPHWNVSLMAWLWIFPLLLALWLGDGAKIKSGKAQAWRGFGLGYLAGLAFFIPNMAWIRHSSRVISGATDHVWMGWSVELLGIGAVLGMSLYLSIYWGVWGAFTATICKARISRTGIPSRGDKGHLFSVSVESLRSAFLCAAAWVACEWLRGWVFTGFSWNGLGVSLVKNVPLIQVAEFVGVTGLSFIPVFIACIGYNTVLRFRQEIHTSRVRPHADFFCGAVLLIGCSGYGVWKMAQPVGETQPLKVLLVQPNVPQAVRWSGDYTDELYQDLGQLTRLAIMTNTPDLVIWPESAIPLDFYDPNHIPFLNEVLALGDFSLLTGTDISIPKEPVYTGAALMKGTFENYQLYRKVHLVPFGEYLPFRSIGIVQTLLGGILPGDFANGTVTEPLIMDRPANVEIIPLICFEDTVGRLARKFVREAPQLIVNMTNDGWFLQSEENEVHLANAVFRSIELRRPMVRSCNTGVTCFVDEFGRIGKGDKLADAHTGSVFIKGVLSKEMQIQKTPVMTFYAKRGDVFSWVMLGVMGLSIVSGIFSRRK